MPDFKELQKNIQEIKTEVKTQEKQRNSYTAPSMEPREEIQEQKRENKENRNEIIEKQPVVPLAHIDKLPVAQNEGPVQGQDINVRRQIYNDRDKKIHEDELTRLQIEIPRDREHLTHIRGAFMEIFEYFDNADKRHTDIRWKEGVSEEIKSHLDWLMEYYKAHDDSLVLNMQEAEIVELPINEHHAVIEGTEKIYEGQDTNNCFCCAGTAMLNQFIRNRNKENEPTRRFDQYSMRAYRPRIKKYDPAGEAIMDEEQRKNYVKEIDKYTGAGKRRVGNVFEMGDYFIDNLGEQKAILNKMYFQMPPMNSKTTERDLKKSNNMKAVFIDKVNEVIRSGNLVGFLETDINYGHYLTITGIDGDEILYLNSSDPAPNAVHRKKVDDFLKRNSSKGYAIELEWLSEMKTPEELTAEYSNLRYDQQTGYSLDHDTADSIENVSQTKGIAVRKEFADMGPGMEGISQVAYIPNPLAIAESESIEEALGRQVNRGAKAQEQQKREEQQRQQEQKASAQNEQQKQEEKKAQEEPKQEQQVQEEEVQKEESKEEEQQEEVQVESQQEQEQEQEERRQQGQQRQQTKQQQAEAPEIKKDKKKTKAEKKAENKAIRAYEKKTKDYAKYGIGFSLDNVDVTAADSARMRKVKEALSEYLKIRRDIFERHHYKSDFASAENQFVKRSNDIMRQDNNQVEVLRSRLTEDERTVLGDAYDVVKSLVQSYMDNRKNIYALERGRERFRQIEHVNEMLKLDNSKFFLSQTRRDILNSVDAKYGKQDSYRKSAMPTWLRAVGFNDAIDVANIKYRNNRIRQKKAGTLPPWYKRALEWTGTGTINTVRRLLMAYNGVGGLVDRTLGLGTMIAANSLTVAGKVVKAPIKLLSCVFNGASKHLFNSKKRWKVDYDLRDGWKNLDDGRRIFRKYMKGAFILPAAVTETLTRGIPYIFGHRFKSGVYKRTTRWTKAIYEDVKDIAKGIGIKDYGAADRADEEYKSITRLTTNDADEVYEYDSSLLPGEDDLYDEKEPVTELSHSFALAKEIQDVTLGVIDEKNNYTLKNIPDQVTLGSEYKSSFTKVLTAKRRAEKRQDKDSRLYQRRLNAENIKKVQKERETKPYDLINKTLTKQAMRISAEDYQDLAMFMSEESEEKNRELVNLYMGKSLKEGPNGLEGQNVQYALDKMAAQLFAIDISALHLENDKAMAENAMQLEKIAGQVAAFDRMAKKHNFTDNLNEKQHRRLEKKLQSLRAISAYYNIRKEIITDRYYEYHYNFELSLDKFGAVSKELEVLADKLLQSQILARSMMRLNGVDVDALKYDGKTVKFKKKAMHDHMRKTDEEYRKEEKHEEISRDAHVAKSSFAQKELLRLQKAITKLNKENPIKEQKNIQANMNKVMDKAFEPVQFPENRTGGLSKLKNLTIYGLRWLVGGVFTLPLSVITNALTEPVVIVSEARNKSKAQDKRRHDMVPGREGETFRDEIIRKDEKGEDIDVYSDVRRGPLVWEKLSAGNPEDPPEVIIMTQQGKRGSKTAMTQREMGHAMIGLSYSRYNKSTGKKERYQLRMGFYPGGGLQKTGQFAMSGGAIVGGSLDEDNTHVYDIARRYKVKPGDINTILREAEKYADKGYGYFKRNCTTFVVDMARAIGLDVADEFVEDHMIFKGQDAFEVQVGSALAGGGYNLGTYGITSRMNKMDLRYQNFGQKLYTKEDLDRYHKSAGTGELVFKTGYSPGSAGETLRRTSDGDLTAKFKEHDGLPMHAIREYIDTAGYNLWQNILLKVGGREDKLTAPEDVELKEILYRSDDAGLSDISGKPEELTPENIRKKYNTIRNRMEKVNRYYRERLGNDKDLNTYVLQYLSLCEVTLSYADKLYQQVIDKAAVGDAGELRLNFNKKDSNIAYTDENGVKIQTDIPLGIYEGYLMAGLTPDRIIEDHARYQQLKAIDADERTDEEEAEFNSLNKWYRLAEDFASANRYMLEKDEFDDKDIKYAFCELPKKEFAVEKGKVSGSMVSSRRPSHVYQGVILEKLFGGIRALGLNKMNNSDEVTKKLDDYFMGCIEKNEDLAGKILASYIDGKTQEAEGLCADFITDMYYNCVGAAYSNVREESQVDFTAIMMSLLQGSRFREFIIDKISSIRKGGGAA